MKRLMLVTLSFAVLTTLACMAQEPTAQDKASEVAAQDKQAQKPASTTTVTGCLQKGRDAANFSITGEDKRTWDVSSSTVKLDEHVGHQVAVTGSANREPKTAEKTEEKKEGQMEKAADKEEYGDLLVTDLKMLSATCSK